MSILKGVAYKMIFIIILISIGVGIGKQTNDYFSTITFPNNFVSSINTVNYDKTEVKKILDDFNALTDTDIVKYNTDYALKRPIHISEGYLEGNTIGQSRMTIFYCKIILSSGMSYEMLKHVLLHEYLHCMGYGHSNIREDLMYPYYTQISEENLKKYALDLEKRLQK